MTQVKIVNFFIGGIDDFEKAESGIEELVNNGFEPLMCLTRDKNYVIWAFVKELKKK